MVAVWVAADCRCGRAAQRYPPPPPHRPPPAAPRMLVCLRTDPTGVRALAWTDLPTPAPQAGEVLIEIRAASLNFPDLLIVQNKYQKKPPLPFVPGSEY